MVHDYDRSLEDNQEKIKENKQFNDDQPAELKNLAFGMKEKNLHKSYAIFKIIVNEPTAGKDHL